MVESIFDPNNPHRERSGNRNMGPDAANISHQPPGVVDGEARDEEAEEAAEAGANDLTDVPASEPPKRGPGKK